MPLFFQQNINAGESLAVWEITEDETFFMVDPSWLRPISHPHKRLQHAAGRYLLRWMDPSFPLDQIIAEFARKPYLPTNRSFSISHSGKYAAAILSEHQSVGIDVEGYSANVLKVLHKFLSTTEQQRLLRSNYTPYFIETLCWSTKEAVFKWFGKGGVDFREDIQIEDISQTMDDTFMLSVRFRSQPLTVYGKAFTDCCLTWVSADISV
jgi:phosphopantetheinyl transferase